MAIKKISDLTFVSSVQDTDLLIVETSDGTRTTNVGSITSSSADDANVGLKMDNMKYTDANGATLLFTGGEIFNHYPEGDTINLDENGTPTNGNLASGLYSHAEGFGNIASAPYSHVEGRWNIASGDDSHAEGCQTVAIGLGSHAEGGGTVASGVDSHAEGNKTNASGTASHAEGCGTQALSYQHASGKYNDPKTAPATADTQDTSGADAIFLIGYGTPTTRANAFRVASNGKCRGSTTFTGSGADFAELFEWSDGNPNNEDRRGLFVTLDGEKIKLANANDDYIGVISGAQAFIGNTASEEWHGKYLTDVFGTRLSQEIKIPEKIDEKTGEVVTPTYTTTQYVVNPDYNPDEKYIMRENRKEWGIVGLLGQVVVIDDGTCTVGGYCKPSINGIGTTSDSGYRVMKRIDENHIKVLVK